MYSDKTKNYCHKAPKYAIMNKCAKKIEFWKIFFKKTKPEQKNVVYIDRDVKNL